MKIKSIHRGRTTERSEVGLPLCVVSCRPREHIHYSVLESFEVFHLVCVSFQHPNPVVVALCESVPISRFKRIHYWNFPSAVRLRAPCKALPSNNTPRISLTTYTALKCPDLSIDDVCCLKQRRTEPASPIQPNKEVFPTAAKCGTFCRGFLRCYTS